MKSYQQVFLKTFHKALFFNQINFCKIVNYFLENFIKKFANENKKYIKTHISIPNVFFIFF